MSCRLCLAHIDRAEPHTPTCPLKDYWPMQGAGTAEKPKRVYWRVSNFKKRFQLRKPKDQP